MKITTMLATLALALGAFGMSGCATRSNSDLIADLKRQIEDLQSKQDSGKKCRADRIKRYAYRIRGQETSPSPEEDAPGRQPDAPIDAVRLELAGMGWIETTHIGIPFDKLNERLITICPSQDEEGKGKLRYGGYDGDYLEMYHLEM